MIGFTFARSVAPGTMVLSSKIALTFPGFAALRLQRQKAKPS
jgi:hypothetical protein